MIEREARQFLFEKALDFTGVGLIITDPSIKDNPITFVNKGFLNMTGYDQSEVLGENCRFLQGPETKKESIDKIREAIAKEASITIQIFNYRKDGTTFWNELSIDPMWVEEENKLYFVGVQKDVTEEKAKERELTKKVEEIERISTPIVPIKENVAVLPIIGTMGDSRLEALMNTLSNYLETSDEEYLILDLSGLYKVDSYTASRLLKIHQFVKLMGKELLVVGVRPDMAVQTVAIQDKLKGLKTFKDVKAALHAIDNF